jgi:hypothetical protein
VLGAEALELDLGARTVGLPLIADREWDSLPEETRRRKCATEYLQPSYRPDHPEGFGT